MTDEEREANVRELVTRHERAVAKGHKNAGPGEDVVHAKDVVLILRLLDAARGEIAVLREQIARLATPASEGDKERAARCFIDGGPSAQWMVEENVAAALAQARRQGAEWMREAAVHRLAQRAARYVGNQEHAFYKGSLVAEELKATERAIRALPLNPEKTP